jgi:hypothetical protein
VCDCAAYNGPFRNHCYNYSEGFPGDGTQTVPKYVGGKFAHLSVQVYVPMNVRLFYKLFRCIFTFLSSTRCYAQKTPQRAVFTANTSKSYFSAEQLKTEVAAPGLENRD